MTEAAAATSDATCRRFPSRCSLFRAAARQGRRAGAGA